VWLTAPITARFSAYERTLPLNVTAPSSKALQKRIHHLLQLAHCFLFQMHKRASIGWKGKPCAAGND